MTQRFWSLALSTVRVDCAPIEIEPVGGTRAYRPGPRRYYICGVRLPRALWRPVVRWIEAIR